MTSEERHLITSGWSPEAINTFVNEFEPIVFNHFSKQSKHSKAITAKAIIDALNHIEASINKDTFTVPRAKLLGRGMANEFIKKKVIK